MGLFGWIGCVMIFFSVIWMTIEVIKRFKYSEVLHLRDKAIMNFSFGSFILIIGIGLVMLVELPFH